VFSNLPKVSTKDFLSSLEAFIDELLFKSFLELPGSASVYFREGMLPRLRALPLPNVFRANRPSLVI